MKKCVSPALLPALLLLGGCGGGGAGSVTAPPAGGGGGSTVGTPPATIFAASGAGPLVARVYFDINGNSIIDSGDPVAHTDRNGLAGASIAGLMAGAGTIPTAPTQRLLAVGADSATGFIAAALSAPKGATVVSPITTLIDLVGDQAVVRRAFGLSAANGTLRDSTDLLTFNAASRLSDPDTVTAQEAARITTINFRILQLAQLLSRYQGDAVDSGSGTGPEGAQYIADVIKETGGADFTQADTVLRALQKGGPLLPYHPEQLRVAAETFARFMRIVPTAFSDQQAIYGYHLAFRFFVLANIRSVFAGYPSPELARVSAIGEAEMRDAVARFADTPRPPVGNRSYALPDYVELRATIRLAPSILLRNDITGFPYGAGGAINLPITSVSLDPKFAGQIAVKIDSGQILLEPNMAFSGFVYFDYTARSGDLDTSARVHVWIRR